MCIMSVYLKNAVKQYGFRVYTVARNLQNFLKTIYICYSF